VKKRHGRPTTHVTNVVIRSTTPAFAKTLIGALPHRKLKSGSWQKSALSGIDSLY